MGCFLFFSAIRKKRVLKRKCYENYNSRYSTQEEGQLIGQLQIDANYYFSICLLVSTPDVDLAERTVSSINLG